MYDRKYEDQELQFEASGALKAASLIMRDVETDSWWSIMTSEAIAGDMEGSPLHEMPISAKMQWGDWVAQHPNTRVLAVDGVTYEDVNPYAEYFTSDRTFRELMPDDKRMAPKESIYAFTAGDEAVSAKHKDFEGGRLFRVGEQRVYLYRGVGSSVFESTQAFWVPDGFSAPKNGSPDAASVLAHLAAADASPIAGMDTFWYNWAFQNPESRILE